jgi:hypothetical protein
MLRLANSYVVEITCGDTVIFCTKKHRRHCSLPREAESLR